MKKALLSLAAALTAGTGLTLPGTPSYRMRKRRSGFLSSGRSKYTPHQGRQEIARRRRQGVHFTQWKPFPMPELQESQS